MIKFTFRIQRIYIHFEIQNTTLNNSITVAKYCEKFLRLNMTSTTRVKVEKIIS